MQLAIMRRTAMLLTVIFGFTAISLAQQTVTGQVTDTKGEPLPGVTVSVRGTKNATATNEKGIYTLNNVAADAVLVFTGTGIVKMQEAVNGKTTLNTSVETSVGNLNEIVSKRDRKVPATGLPQSFKRRTVVESVKFGEGSFGSELLIPSQATSIGWKV